MEESDTLKRLYPDYRALLKALPGRTRHAIKNHARQMGILHRRHVWTGAEIARLRKMAAAGVARNEIAAAFAPLTKGQVQCAMRNYGILTAATRRAVAAEDLYFAQMDRRLPPFPK
jgi:hypothetical protein